MLAVPRAHCAPPSRQHRPERRVQFHDKDMEGPEIAAQITRDTELARSLDINGTPGFVIGNRLVPGAIDTQTMQQIVEAERAAAKTRK